MRKTLTKVGIIFAAIAAVFVMSGCSTVSTPPDKVALHYSGGGFSSQDFQNCVEPGTRNYDGPSDKHYYYPAGQRTFSFTGRSGSETKPIAVTTKEGNVEYVPGFVTFTLNTDCDVLRKFHETVGIKYKAYSESGDGTSDGWSQFLNDYIETPLITAMNKASQQYDWRALYSDTATQQKFEQTVKDSLPGLVQQALGSEYLTVNAVSISKPTIGAELQQSIEQVQVNKQANLAQKELNEQLRTEYDTYKDCKKVLSEDNCVLLKAIKDGAVSVIPVPRGTTINVSPSK